MPKGSEGRTTKRQTDYYKIKKMQIRIFTVPILDNGEQLHEMNSFLSSQKVLEIEQQFYQNATGAFWTFCVRYISSGSGSLASYSNKQKTDYKEVLSENEFAVFSKLRECRKIIATNEAIPAYAVFTDEELAGIAKLPEIVANKLSLVKGIGDKKAEKFGQMLVDLYASKLSENETTR